VLKAAIICRCIDIPDTTGVAFNAFPRIPTTQMKKIYEVLQQKETELQQLQKDIEALRVAARLLSDDNNTETAASRPPSSSAPKPRTATAVADTPGPAAVVRHFP
jgi:hypothetical protein